ncbi:MAG: FAD binding domain-containing protein, partial [Firmicutes bacterium]|nr:FAD binding domain-containing protein [Bacillota bacterium]
MKPAVFQYRKAETTREALEALGTNPGAKVLAGGQSLVPLMNFRLSRPDVLVDINGIEELTLVEKLDQTLAIGALVRHSTLPHIAHLSVGQHRLTNLVGVPLPQEHRAFL